MGNGRFGSKGWKKGRGSALSSMPELGCPCPVRDSLLRSTSVFSVLSGAKPRILPCLPPSTPTDFSFENGSLDSGEIRVEAALEGCHELDARLAAGIDGLDRLSKA